MRGILVCWIGEGPPPGSLLEDVRGHVEAVFGPPVATAVDRERPEEAWDPRRNQWESGRILRWLGDRHPDAGARILGVSDVDLFLPILTFVFGEAQLGGRAALVSIRRLGGPDGGTGPRSLLAERLRKEAVHELGHAFGLVHCGNAGCAMSRSAGVHEIDMKGEGLCPDCRLLCAETRRRDEVTR